MRVLHNPLKLEAILIFSFHVAGCKELGVHYGRERGIVKSCSNLEKNKAPSL